jgi:hypothetical protein
MLEVFLKMFFEETLNLRFFMQAFIMRHLHESSLLL